MTPFLIITAHGQRIKGPAPTHFMHAENGRRSGFAVAPIKLVLVLEHREGVLKPQAMKMRAFAFWALDRRAPRCLKAARHIATFFLN